MSFSTLLDISSFFIGVLINLLLIAMVCFYFKRKIDNLEMSQSEQAKMLFQLIKEKEHVNFENQVTSTKNVVLSGETNPLLQNIDMSQLSGDSNEVVETKTLHIENINNVSDNDESDDENEDSEDSDYVEEGSDSEEEFSDDENNETEEEENDKQQNDIEVIKSDKSSSFEEVEPLVTSDEDIKSIEYDNNQTDINYEKYTVKELKNMLEGSGVQPKKSLKKQDLIDLLMSNHHDDISNIETEQHDIEEINSEILIEDSVEPVIETEDIGEIEEIIE